MRLISKKTILLSSMVLLFTGCTNQPNQTNNASQDEIKKEAKKAIMKVGNALKSNLITKMKNEGPASAAAFCSINASKLTKDIVDTLPKGISVKRITDRPRNINNKATKEQLIVLNEIKEKIKNGNEPKLLVKQISSNHYQVYKPLKMEFKCLTCHGDEKSRNNNAYNVIKKEYPNDKAINYKLGDFRGAFLVDIKK